MGFQPPRSVLLAASDFFRLFPFISGRYLLLILNDEGRIFIDEKCLLAPNLLKAVRLLSTAQHIQDLFDIPAPSLSPLFSDLAHVQHFMATDYRVFGAKQVFADPDESGYTSDYPTASLVIFALAKDHFLGVVRFPKIDPHHLFSLVHMEVYTDEDGLIRGFNDAFGAQTGKAASELLGHPLAGFLEPLTDFPGGGFPGDQELPWVLEKNLDFTDGEVAGFTLPEGALITDHGLLWRAGNVRRRIFLDLPLKLHLNTQNQKIRITMGPGWNQLPGLVLTADRGNPDFPDARGYHFVLEAIHDRVQATLKRVGQTVAFVTASPLPPEGETCIEFTKLDRWFACTVNGRLILDFLEWDEIGGEQASALLSLIPGAQCTIKNLRVYGVPRVPLDTEATMQLVRLRGAGGAVYHLRRLSQTVAGEKLFAYQLINMSDFDRLRQRHEVLREEKRELSLALSARQGPVPFLGESEEIKKILAQAARVADLPLTVTLEGETGTGKEVLAGALHQMSARREGPFVKVDCATFSPHLLESELFGHEKGAFTGATGRHIGRLEQAGGGTLFLDEISNLPLELQSKLLDFLETFHITRLGGVERIPLDVRVIVASNRPLAQWVREGKFREDLWYRINSVVLRLPPLRERREDIPLLARHFIEQAGRAAEKSIAGIDPAAARKLYHHDWPGNVRELKNVVFSAAFNARSGQIRPSDVVFAERPEAEGTRSYRRYSRVEVEEAMRKTHGNIRQAAFALNVSRATIYRILGRLPDNR